MMRFIDKLVGRLLLPLRGKAPYATNVLRRAGALPHRKMWDLSDELCLLVGVSVGLLVGILLGWLAAREWGFSSGFVSVIPLAVLAFFILMARRKMRQLSNAQIGYYAELRVAEILERLGRPEWHVFHGFEPTDTSGKKYGDIDHIIVCPYGVFCVETKAIRKFPNERRLIHSPGKPHGILRFASGRELPHNPLPKLRERAKILHDKLTRECGGHGYVARILVLPEWEVERKGDDKWEFPCSKSGEIREFISKSETKLEPEQIKTIADFLDGELRKRMVEMH